MKYTKIIKLFTFLGLLFALVSCGGSMTQSIIYRLEDSGFAVVEVEFEDVERIEPEFEVVGAKNIFEIYDRRDLLTAYMYEFESEEDLNQMFEDLDLNIADYEEQIYENLLVVPYEYLDYIGQIMIIIKR